jgi:ribosomal protein S18 acetylase RimI-like enzyme
MLAALGRKAFFEAFGAHNDPADMQAYLDLAFNPDSIQQQLLNPEISYIVACIQNEPVGYAKLKRNSVVPELIGTRAIQLERIYTLQDFIGKKVGKSLMEECIHQSMQENFEKMWLSVWQENEIAIKFYKKWGFEVIGFKQFIIGTEVNDDFVMALDLSQIQNKSG